MAPGETADTYDEEYEEYEEEYETFHPPVTPWWMRKAMPFLTSSVVHLLLLWVAAFVVFTVVNKKEISAVNVTPDILIPITPDWDAPSGIFNKPEIEAPELDELPVRDLIEDCEPPKEMPRGISTKAQANKHLGSLSCNDAYGLGSGLAGAYGERWGKGRFSNNSGSRRTVCAVDRALKWLHYHQDKSGMWDQDGFEKNCDTRESAACDGKGTSQYDVAVSSLALLAFMGHGHTHRVGQFKRTVRRGLEWLRKQQQSDGSLGRRGDTESWIYNHAIGTMALCEAYAVTRDYRLKEPAQKAVDYIRDARNPGLGWKYEPRDGRNDTSVSGWMVLALKAAKTAGLDVDQSMFNGAINWFDRATNTVGRCGYMRPGDLGSVIKDVNDQYEKLPTMTGVSVICRIFCGQSRRDPKVKKGVDILMQNLPDWNKPKNDKVDMYYWYYATYAMFQFGGEKWRKWNEAMKKALLKSQRVGGCPDGSWDPLGKWGMVGGRVYATAINALTLEIYYRYARAKEKDSVVAGASR